jgi:hypothetical protein
LTVNPDVSGVIVQPRRREMPETVIQKMERQTFLASSFLLGCILPYVADLASCQLGRRCGTMLPIRACGLYDCPTTGLFELSCICSTSDPKTNTRTPENAPAITTNFERNLGNIIRENSGHAAAAIQQTWKDASAALENSGHAAAAIQQTWKDASAALENSGHAAAATIQQTWEDASATLDNSGHAAAVVDSS